jgi:hypothetical protein
MYVDDRALEDLMEEVPGMSVFDPAEEVPTLEDYEVAERNYRNFYARRGRICRYPGCENKIRYTRDVPVCSEHELTEFATCLPEAHTTRGRRPNPRLNGLAEARIQANLEKHELALLLGRPARWVHDAERGRVGVSDKTRGEIAAVLGVSESFLLEGGSDA